MERKEKEGKEVINFFVFPSPKERKGSFLKNVFPCVVILIKDSLLSKSLQFGRKIRREDYPLISFLFFPNHPKKITWEHDRTTLSLGFRPFLSTSLVK